MASRHCTTYDERTVEWGELGMLARKSPSDRVRLSVRGENKGAERVTPDPTREHVGQIA